MTPSEERHQWRIVIGPTEAQATGQPDPQEMATLIPPPGRYWADPFLVRREDGHHVFFEDFDIASRRGRICAGRLTEDGIGGVTVAMAPEHHLSYPHLFTHRGELYLVPESAEVGRVDLFRCTSFPSGWVRQRTLIEGVSAVDSTLYFRDGRWWLFTNLDRLGTGDFGHELHLFSSDDLLAGTFRPHPANPIVADARHARMAGPLLETADALLRPAQLGGRAYGSGLRIMRVEHLGVDHYEEVLEREIRPEWSSEIVGVHHLCVAGPLTAMDVCQIVPRRPGKRR